MNRVLPLSSEELFSRVVALTKRRGFVFPGSEIYGGLANTYDYGPLGAELFKNIQDSWWNTFVSHREDVVGIFSSVLMNPQVWVASGHVERFADVKVDCKKCRKRFRADHLIEEYFARKGKEVNVEGRELSELQEIIEKEKIVCPSCGAKDWTDPRPFKLLFETSVGIIPGEENKVYLRGELAQGMFVDFKQVVNSLSPKLPFGIAQMGPAFRNEISLGKFMFRLLQFYIAELEYFFDPQESDWNKLFDDWKRDWQTWFLKEMKISPDHLRWREHTADELAHYSKRTEDLEYLFPFGFKEVGAVAYRTDFDLKNHAEKSGKDLFYTKEDGSKIIPHVIEPTFGLDRVFLSLLFEHYREEETDKGQLRRVLSLPPNLSPFQVAVFPLLANRENLVKKAREVFDNLLPSFRTAWDSRGNIGKRYFSQDEIGTPFCLTIDFETLESKDLTIRDRETTAQKRVKIEVLVEVLKDLISGKTSFSQL